MKSHSNILSTKLNAPLLNPKHIKRNQLYKILDSNSPQKLTLLSAPAGFGKTSLLVDWLDERKLTAAWLSLDENDNDPVQFLSYLVAALQTIDPSVGTAALEQLAMPQLASLQTPIIDLINDISSLNKDIVFILDDFHLVENNITLGLATFFIENMPPNLQLILLGRYDPPIPLAKLRSCGLLTEIRAEELSFSLEEAGSLFHQEVKSPVSTHEIELIHTKTEGWIAGLQLAIISMQKRDDISGFLRQFDGGHQFIVDYLMEEALNHLPENIMQFLLHTCVMKNFCADLCDSVTGQVESREHINFLEQNNMFIFVLDDQKKWFRYHHLFADLLQKRLEREDPSIIPVLHKRCAQWYAENNFKLEALEHAVAVQDFPMAADLVESLAEEKWEYGQQTGVLQWFDALPDSVFESRPMLSLLYAKELLFCGRFEQAMAKLQPVEQSLATEPKSAKLDGRIASIKAFVALCTGDIPAIISQAEIALNKLNENEFVWRGLSAVLAGIAYYWLGTGNTESAKAKMIEAVEFAQKQKNNFLYLTNSIQVIITEKNQGMLNSIYQRCEQLLKFADDKGLSHSGIMGLIYAEMGDILVEQNDFAQGMLYLEKAIKCAENDVDLFRQWNCHDHYARALFYSQEYEKALKILNKILSSITSHPMPPWFINITLAQKATLLVATGNISGAEEIIQQTGIDANSPLIIILEPLHIANARILIAQEKYTEAFSILSQLSEITEADTRFKVAIEIRILKALVLFQQNEMEQAVAEIIEALSLGEPGSFITIFNLEGKPIAGLIKRAMQLKSANHKFTKNYAEQVLAAFKLDAETQFESDQLSRRELDVLKCIEQGMSNQEISEKLFISLNTVKTHLKRMSSKLDAKNRTEIVARAREEGLI